MVNLPDASKITLQKNTRVGYKKYSWPFNREVTLEGEAFFEVAKGETFTVTTSNGSVKVLGTSFNVNTKNDLLLISCYGVVLHALRHSVVASGRRPLS